MQRVLEAPGEGGAAAGGGAVAAADVPVRIRLLAVDQLSTQISFQGDPFSRPRWVQPCCWLGLTGMLDL